jgi:hypothetical protein
MQISGNSAGAAGAREIITTIGSPAEARALPPGVLVGDLHGGVTFSDAVAQVLESRSLQGWREVSINETSWTVIEVYR